MPHKCMGLVLGPSPGLCPLPRRRGRAGLSQGLRIHLWQELGVPAQLGGRNPGLWKGALGWQDSGFPVLARPSKQSPRRSEGWDVGPADPALRPDLKLHSGKREHHKKQRH